MFTTLYKVARAISTLAGISSITNEEKRIFIKEMKSSLSGFDLPFQAGRSSTRASAENLYFAFRFMETQPDVSAKNKEQRYRMANEVCAILQSKKIDAFIESQSLAIVFVEYKSHSGSAKAKLVGLLDALDSELEKPKATTEEIKANDEILKTVKPGSW